MLAFLNSRPLKALVGPLSVRSRSPFAALTTITAMTAAMLLASGCEETKNSKKPAKAATKISAPSSKTMPKAAHPARKMPRAKAPRPADLVSWDAPTGLTKIKPKNSFRRASYEVPPGKGEKVVGILNVFAFGGDVDSNVTRWKGQFDGLDAKAVKRTDREVNGLKQTILEIPKGKYSGGMAPEEGGEDYGMLAALIPVRPKGAKADVLYIFKMTGPSGGVAAAKTAFMATLDSIKLTAPKAPATAKPKMPEGKAKEATKPKH